MIDAVVFLVLAIVFAVIAIGIGMMLAPLVGRLSPADDEPADDTEEPG